MLSTHPRQIGFLTTSALALGGSNLSLFLIASLITHQGSMGILLLSVGIVISWLALPGWVELVLMNPDKVGGIPIGASQAFRAYSPLVSNMTGVAYWSCTIPGISFAAIFVATSLQSWFFPHFSINVIGTVLVLFFIGINLGGIKWVSRFAIPVAAIATLLSLLSVFIPVFYHKVNWIQTFNYEITAPFEGFFGKFTSVMGGIYLIAFAAPAFEQGLCYAGEMKNPRKDILRTIGIIFFISAIFYIGLPLVWYGSVGSTALTQNTLWSALGPTFSPLLHHYGKIAAETFMFFNSLVCLMSALSCATRAFYQLSADKLIPKIFSYRTSRDTPWAALLASGGIGILLVWMGSPNWLMAATNYEYVLVLMLASIAPCLLRRDAPDHPRLYRAPNFTLVLGLISASILFIATVFGFQQFGLVAMVGGIAFPFIGLLFYGWQKLEENWKNGISFNFKTLHVKLTGSMLTVMVLDATGYLIAVSSLPQKETLLITALEDIFVVVALLSLSVGILMPSAIANAVSAVSHAAEKLSRTTLADFSKAMKALAKGNLEAAHVEIEVQPIVVHAQDEIGQMAKSFNLLQEEIKHAATSLDGAREGLREARNHLVNSNKALEDEIKEGTQQLILIYEEMQNTLDTLYQATDVKKALEEAKTRLKHSAEVVKTIIERELYVS